VEDRWVEEAMRDQPTITPAGDRLDSLPEGLSFFDLVTHTDERGTVCELYDPRKGWHVEPLVFAYCFTIRPGYAKGWNLHERHEDRYAIIHGELERVLYDTRPGSPTNGLLASVVLSDHRRRLVNVPAGVWHADRNIGAHMDERLSSGQRRVPPFPPARRFSGALSPGVAFLTRA
jgi:dTDP-4-dehydrorhamnose 3,5-epimerase